MNLYFSKKTRSKKNNAEFMLHIVRADLSNTWALMYNEGNIKYKGGKL